MHSKRRSDVVIRLMLALIVFAQGASCTFVGVYGAPVADPSVSESLRLRVSERVGRSHFVVDCPRSGFGCPSLVRGARAALLDAGMTPLEPGVEDPGAFVLRVMGGGGDVTGWIILSALTAGLIPAPLDGAAMRIHARVYGPCGRRFSVVVIDRLNAWASGPFLPSAWLAGPSIRAFAIYNQPGGYSGRHALEEAYGDAARRAVLDLLNRLADDLACPGK